MEVYDLAVKLSMQDGISKIIGALGHQVPILGKHFDKLKEGVNKTSVAIAGLGAAMAGLALGKGLEKIEEHGEKLVHAKTLLEASLPIQDRLTDSALAYAAAWKEAGTNLRTNITENIEAIHDLYNVTQSIEHANKLLPAFNILKNSFDSVKDQESLHGSNNSRDIASAVRAFEMAGRNTTETLEAVTKSFTQTNIALRGRVTGGGLLTQISSAGDSRYGFSDDFLTKVIPAMIATGLGNRTGSALNAGSNNLYGGVSSSILQMQNQIKWGLHSEEDYMDPKHKKPGFTVGTMWHGDEFRTNPLEWANHYRDFLKDFKHVDVENTKEMQNVIGEIGRGNKLLKAELDELLLPATNRQLNKEVANISRVGADAMENIDKNDPKSIRQAMWKQWDNTLEGFGEQLVKPMMDNIIKPLTLALRDVSQFAAAHPEGVAAIGKGLLVVSAGLTGLGVALVGGALLAAIGAGGWVVVGIASLAAALKLFRPDMFSAVVDGYKKIWDGLVHLDFGKVVSGIAQTFNAEMLGLPGMVAGAIGQAIAGIGAAISSKLSGIGSGIGKWLHTPDSGFGPPGTPAAPLGEKHGALVSPIAPRSKTAMLEFHHTSVIDGKKVAQAVTRHQVAMAEHPNSIGAMDTYGSHAGPGTDIPAWG